MKVFCGGSQIICGCNSTITERIDEYILSQAELLVTDTDCGDDNLQQYLNKTAYKNVTVVFMRESWEYEEWPRVNKGGWPFREFIRRQYEYDIDLSLVSAMAEECDEAFTVWCEPDWEAFMSVLCFIANDKACSIYNLKNDAIRKLNTLDELLQYVAEETEIELRDGYLSVENTLNIDELLQYIDFPDKLKEKISSGNNDTRIHKQDLKKLICNSSIPVSKKNEMLEKLADRENLYAELIGTVSAWKTDPRDKKELYRLLMGTMEHSFFKASKDLSTAESWINKADGNNEDIVLYLFERFMSEDRGVTDIPVGIYADISEALYYLQSSVFDSSGGRIDVWEKTRGPVSGINYEHRLSLYSDHKDVIGFEFMRVADPVNDCDPFEPVTYQSLNKHYMNL